MKKGFLTITLAGLAMVVAPQAQGAISFALTDSFCSGNCGSGPFGTVQLDQLTSTSVKVTVTLTPGDFFVKTGAGEALAFNVTGSAITSITGLTTGFTAGSGGLSKGDIGAFSNFVHCDGCGSGGSSPLAGPLVFTVNRSAGLVLADFVKSTGGSAGGLFFTSDVLANGNTGNVGAPGPGVIVTPEPLTMSLVGAGLLAIGLLKKNRRLV